MKRVRENKVCLLICLNQIFYSAIYLYFSSIKLFSPAPQLRPNP